MELIYLYIGKTQRVLENIGINFSDCFDVKLESTELLIRKKQAVHVYNKEIRSLTTIVGPNGCGKSTILDLLYLSGSKDVMNLISKDTVGTIRLFHISDSEEDSNAGFFYLQECSDSPISAKIMNNGPIYSKSNILSFLFKYDYIAQKIVDSRLCENNKGKQVDAGKEWNLWDNPVPKTIFLYHPVIRDYYWFSSTKHESFDKGIISSRVLGFSYYALLKYLYEASRGNFLPG